MRLDETTTCTERARNAEAERFDNHQHHPWTSKCRQRVHAIATPRDWRPSGWSPQGAVLRPVQDRWRSHRLTP